MEFNWILQTDEKVPTYPTGLWFLIIFFLFSHEQHSNTDAVWEGIIFWWEMVKRWNLLRILQVNRTGRRRWTKNHQNISGYQRRLIHNQFQWMNRWTMKYLHLMTSSKYSFSRLSYDSSGNQFLFFNFCCSSFSKLNVCLSALKWNSKIFFLCNFLI